jgi:uncharacterized protein (TIGR03083 family)
VKPSALESVITCRVLSARAPASPSGMFVAQLHRRRALEGGQMNPDDFDLAENYRITRERLSVLVGGVEDASAVAVPACPGWSVHDVTAHLTGVVEDVLEGRLTRPPTDEETAAQVARRRGRPTSSVLDDWAEVAPGFEELLSRVRVWPAFLDVLAHEHDIRGAIGRPEGWDAAQVQVAAERLMALWEPPVRVLVQMEPAEMALGPDAVDGEPLRLTTTPFEAFRFRLGRRSAAQLRAMDWSGDPAPVLGGMTIFGPEPYDVVE